MATNDTTTEISSAENRTRRARDEDMDAVVAEPVSVGDDDTARINVQNHSSGGTIYTVTVQADGTVSDCTCPDAQYNLNDGEIGKHGRFVAAHDCLLIAATGDVTVGTECACADLSDGFPCWKCYASGKKDLPK